MVIKSEWEYRYILKTLDRQLDFMKELRCDHMEDLAKALPELRNNAMYMRVEKLRNRIIMGFKENGCKYPFSVET